MNTLDISKLIQEKKVETENVKNVFFLWIHSYKNIEGNFIKADQHRCVHDQYYFLLFTKR